MLRSSMNRFSKTGAAVQIPNYINFEIIYDCKILKNNQSSNAHATNVDGKLLPCNVHFGGAPGGNFYFVRFDHNDVLPNSNKNMAARCCLDQDELFERVRKLCGDS